MASFCSNVNIEPSWPDTGYQFKVFESSKPCFIQILSVRFGKIPKVCIVARAPEILQPFFRLIFQTTLPCADLNRFFFKEPRTRMSIKDLISSVQLNEWFTPSIDVRFWHSGMTRSPIGTGIRAPWSHLIFGQNGWALLP